MTVLMSFLANEFHEIARKLKGYIKAPMQKSVDNKNYRLPTTEQVKEWTDMTGEVLTETVRITKKDLSRVC
jgi:hypothetical protein